MFIPIVIRSAIVDGDGNLLVIQRSGEAKLYSGIWEFPGGKHDRAGSTLFESLIEEVGEETRLRDVSLAPQVAHVHQRTIPDGQHKGRTRTTFTYPGLVRGRQEVVISHEHTGFQWLPLDLAAECGLRPECLEALLHLQPYLLL